jgi:glycosyltransferase involved in cell wall biosynthesis
MTRIALVSPYTLPFLCGNSFLAERLREGLTGRGYIVSLFDSGRDSPDEAASFAPQILHSLNAERPHQWVREFLTKYPAPWVITLTGTDYNSWCGKEDPPPHIRENLEKADALVVFHEEARGSLEECLPSVARKLCVIPQGVAFSEIKEKVPELRRELGFGADDLVFLMVSSIRPVKNIEAALRAFSEVEKEIPKVRLILIGPILDQEEGRRILELGRALRCFEYLGEKPQSEVRKVMAASDVFLNTSLNEGMPGAVLEAMAEGLPLLVSATTGNSSLVTHGRNGLLFRVGEAEELIEAAIKLARDARMREEMGEIGKQMVAALYSIERELALHESLYSRLIQERDQGATASASRNH